MYIPNTHISDRFFLWLTGFAAAFALFMHYGIATTNVSRQEWKKPATHIIKHYQPGDVIGVLPMWALQGAEPLRKHPIMYREDFSKADLTRYRRLWLVVAPQLGKWWFNRAFRKQIALLRKLYWMKQKLTFGPLELYLFKMPKPLPLLYDFGAKQRLKQAEVWLHKPQINDRTLRHLQTVRKARLIKTYRKTIQQMGFLQSLFKASPEKLAERNLQKNPLCPSNSKEKITYLKRWEAKPGWWRGRGNYFFGRIIQEIGDTPRDCLWAQPKACQVLRVRYRLVPFQGTLHFGHGVGTAAPSKVTGTIEPSGPEIQVGLWIENQLVKRFAITEKQKWRSYQIPLHRLKLNLPPLPKSLSSTKRTVSVEFRIQAPFIRKTRSGYCFQAKIQNK